MLPTASADQGPKVSVETLASPMSSNVCCVAITVSVIECYRIVVHQHARASDVFHSTTWKLGRVMCVV
jgi:hypothetical protein